MSIIHEMFIQIGANTNEYWTIYNQEIKKLKDKDIIKQAHYYAIDEEASTIQGFIFIRFEECITKNGTVEKLHRLLTRLDFKFTSKTDNAGKKYRVYQNKEYHLLCLYPFEEIKEEHIQTTKEYLLDAGLMTEEKFDRWFQEK